MAEGKGSKRGRPPDVSRVVHARSSAKWYRVDGGRLLSLLVDRGLLWLKLTDDERARKGREREREREREHLRGKREICAREERERVPRGRERNESESA